MPAPILGSPRGDTGRMRAISSLQSHVVAYHKYKHWARPIMLMRARVAKQLNTIRGILVLFNSSDSRRVRRYCIVMTTILAVA